MKIIVGLGNPGSQYQNNRHNAGWLALDLLVQDLQTVDNWKKQFQSKTLDVTVEGQKITLMKPQTFMNDSGKAVKDIVNFYKLKPSTDILILHDEVDLPFGTIRVVTSCSSAGQNGVQNIIDELGTQDFHRIRIGVETRESRAEIGTRDFVLQNFTVDELERLKKEVFPKIKVTINKFLDIDLN